MTAFLWFLAGFFLGGSLGVVVAALLFVARAADKSDYNIVEDSIDEQ